MQDRKRIESICIPLLKLDNFLIVSLQGMIDDKNTLKLQDDISNTIANSDIKGLLLDVSGLILMDSFVARAILRIAEIAETLGSSTVVTGFSPEVAISSSELGINLTKVETALNLQKGIDYLRNISKR